MSRFESVIPISGGSKSASRGEREAPVSASPEIAEYAGANGPNDDFEPRERSEQASRVFNFSVALAMLVVATPVMAVTAALIRLTSRGPVFYTQVRVGIDRRWNRTRALHERRREDLGGIPFTIYKFRSMRVDAEVNGQAVWATQNDDRVTPIGRFIRKSRIDELPQLYNVLVGDMNIVGPRPERPSIFVRLREQIEEYPVRQRVKPGITGLAQVSNPYDRDLDDVRRKVYFDIQYMRRQSLWEDIRIMLMTVPVMIFRIGAH
ncbi:sugar transferase [Gemmatimonas phototrophica]|uniref:sugar transferase n=1 Tax=Gemmatimonas phototrophica TaxID=1379270 RepID=UPI0006A6C44E|nr:sugar transferase [Gemmatimonas phototrophica]